MEQRSITRLAIVLSSGLAVGVSEAARGQVGAIAIPSQGADERAVHGAQSANLMHPVWSQDTRDAALVPQPEGLIFKSSGWRSPRPTPTESPQDPPERAAPAAPAQPEASAPAEPSPAPETPAPETPAPAQPQPAGDAASAPTAPASTAPAPGADAAPAQPNTPAPPTPAPAPPDTKVHFNFSNAPFEQVIDLFSRETGLPVIRQAPPPAATMTFISPESYTFEEGMSILNRYLNMHQVQLRLEGNYLFLSTLKEAARQVTRVFPGDLPEGVMPDEIVTLTIPLHNAKADIVVPQIEPLVSAEYGRITSVSAQNSIIVVETAAQCRRILKVVQEIDRALPDAETKLFPLKHARAESVAEALKSLIRVRQTQIIINEQKGTRQQVEDTNIEGINFFADARTNSILVVGPASRIEMVSELIALLDVPETGAADQQMMTFALETMKPADAAKALESLFKALPEGRRPTVLPLDGVNKITVVGAAAVMSQAMALLGEIDPGVDGQNGRAVSPERVARLVALDHVSAEDAAGLLTRLLSPRQQQSLRFAPSPDGHGLIVAGPAGDVESLSLLLAGIDVAGDSGQEIRQVRIGAADAPGVLKRAADLYARSGRETKEPVSATMEPDGRTVTLIGSRDGIGRFEELLRSAQATVVVESETRTYALKQATPSGLAARLERLARPMLEPADGRTYEPPRLEPVDEMRRLIVRAAPSQFAVVEELILQLDQPQPGSSRFQVVRVSGGKPREIADRAMEVYKAQSAGMAEGDAGPVTVEVDEPTGNLIIRGGDRGVALFSQVLSQVQQLVPPQRTTRIVEVRNRQAGDILPTLSEFLAAADPIDAARTVPPPQVRLVESTNSLVVTAEEAQHALVADFVTRLDRIEQTDLPPLKLLQLRTADAVAIAGMLGEQYSQRPQTDRVSRPVDVRADAASNTLIVSAHPDLYEEIRTFVEELNREQMEGPEKETIVFPLKVAKAEQVAAAMEKLYPPPPTPVDRRGVPMPWAQQPREVTVSADASSNTLMIYAPAEQIESLRELASKLDRVELPPQAELRTYRVLKADLTAISQTLQGLSRQGVLSAPPEPGSQAVQVMIDTEPRSGTLIVAGDEVTFERVETMLKELSAVPVEKGLRIVPISNATAADVRERALAIYNAQIAQIPGANPVEVTVDEASNSLSVVADAEGMERFTKIMDELQRQGGPAREIRMIELRFAKAPAVVGYIDDLLKSSRSLGVNFGSPPVLEAIEETNSLLIAAQPSHFTVIEALVKSLDARQNAERPPLRILQLKVTEAANLASVLQRSYDTRPLEQRTRLPVDVSADPATNTLIVSAHPDILPEIESLVTELNDAQDLSTEGREIRIFPLKVARAEELARTIDEMYPEPPMPVDRRGVPQPHLRQPKDIFVRADRATNSLIVDAPAKRLAGFQQLVESLDQTSPALDVELRTYRVERADLDAVARTLRDLASGGALVKTSRAPVTVNTEPSARTLIVSGPAEAFAAVENVLKEMDGVAQRPASGMRMYALKNARAERLQPLLTQLLTTRVREQQAAGGLPAAEVSSLLDVAADRGSNTLIISAPEAVQQVAEELIKTLDVEGAAIGRNMLRVVPLTFAEAQEVATNLNAALPTIELPSGGTVTVMPASSGGAVLLSGAAADLDKVGELIAQMDVQPPDPERPDVATFELQHADADTIAATVERLLIDQQETDPRILRLQLQYARNRPDLFKRPAIRVQAEPRTNALIVSGPAATLELAKTVIDRLDQPPQGSGVKALTFTPENADPAALAASVTRIVNATLPQGRKPLELVPDPTTRAILVLGSQEQIAEAVRLLGEFDERSVQAPVVDFQAFDLREADAPATAATVQAMLSDRSRWPEALLAAERAGVRLAAPTVNADAKSNRLLVSAPAVLMDLARELVATLDRPGQQQNVDMRVFQLRKGDAATVAEAIRAALAAGAKPGEPAPVVTPEPTSNSVVVTASAARIEQASQLVQSMDDAVEPESVGVRTIYLKHARAEAVAPVIESVLVKESVFEMLPGWMRGEYLMQSGGKVTDEVRVAAERRLNAIVISAPVRILELAEQIVTELDAQAAGGAGGRAVRVIPVNNADAAELAANIEGVFADEQATEEPPTVRVDTASNSLIVRASAEQMATIEGLAKQLDAATISTSRQLRMIPVDRSRADAGVMAETLRRLLEQKGGVKVEVISIDQLLEKPEEPKKSGALWPGDRSYESYRSYGTHRTHEGTALARAVAAAVAAAAVGAVQPEEPAATAAAQPARADETSGVVIAVDPATNSLVIIGSPRMTDRLAALAAELEKQMPAEPSKVRIVPLPEGVPADSLAALVQQTVQQIGQRAAQNPGGFTGRVAVAQDPTGAALIVWANDTDFETVGQLIASVARIEPAGSLTVKIYPLTMVSAADAERAIGDLVSARPAGAQAQRLLRSIDITLEGPEGEGLRGVIQPGTVRVVRDPSDTSIIVAAPAETIPLIDRFVSLIDQSPVTDRLAIRRYDLKNARADDLAPTLQQLFDAQRQGARRNDIPQARFAPDDRTNSLMVTATEAQHRDVARLLETSDAPASEDGLELAIIPLKHASPTMVQRIVSEVVMGRDPGRAEKIRTSAEDDSSLFVVRGTPEDIAEVREIVASVDVSEAAGLPVRSIKLERADAQTVAAALQRFFNERSQAQQRRGQRDASRPTVIGDRRSSTLVVAANEGDFEQIESLVATFDAPAPSKDLQWRIIRLEHARAADLDNMLENLTWMLQSERVWGNRAQDAAPDDKLYIDVNEPLNSVVVMGQGETLEVVGNIVKQLDMPPSEVSRKIVRAVPVQNADLDAIARVVEQSFQETSGDDWWWWDERPSAVSVEVDEQRGLVILIGKQQQVEQAEEFVKELAAAGGGPEQKIESIALKHAEAERAAQSLRQFFNARAQSQGLPRDRVTVMGSRDGNLLVVAAPEEEMGLLRDLVARIDQDELGDDRRTDVFYLTNADAGEAATVLRDQFPRTARAEDRVLVTPQPSTNSLIVSAKGEDFEQVQALIRELDTSREDLRIVTVQLKNARAAEVSQALQDALPQNLKLTVTAVPRSNSLMLTGPDEAIRLAQEHIGTLDQEKATPLVEFRKVVLKHAIASEVYFTLNEMNRARRRPQGEASPSIDYSPTENTIFFTAAADDIEPILKMIEELDVPAATTRKIDFVKLEFAPAEQVSEALRVFYGPGAREARTPGARNVSVVADAASNSLMISAEEAEWEPIRALIKQFDREEYDTQRQLAVIPLKHSDARSVAQSLNEGFRAPIESRVTREQARAQQGGGRNQRPDGRDDGAGAGPAVLIADEDTPSVSAEVQTNSLIVFAGRKDLNRIRAIVEQLDSEEFARLNDTRIIPIEKGRASSIADAIRQIFTTPGERNAPRNVLVFGDDASNSLIVRADEADFAQIKALADSLQDRTDQKISVHVLPLKNVLAARIRETVANAFKGPAEELGETVSVEADRGSNSLVIACSDRLIGDIRKLIEELDAALPATPDAEPGQPVGLTPGVSIIDLKSTAPDAMRQMLEGLGVMRPAAPDQPGVVGEAVTVVPLTSRRAIAVVATPRDAGTIASLVRSLDAEPAHPEQRVAVAYLKKNSAENVVRALTGILNPTEQLSGSPPAKAIAEQLRRLSIARKGVGEDPLTLDLAAPIRLVPDQEINAVYVISTEANVASLLEVVESLDVLALGDAVVIRIFPLQNAAAARAKTVVDELFQQGEALRRLPGTQRRGQPTTATGQALAGEIAVAVDDRSNTLFVAGREEAVALVEILINQLDEQGASNWVEPRIVALQHADARRLAETLRGVLIEHQPTPESLGLQNQVARLRFVNEGGDPTDPAQFTESDIFTPLTGLIIQAEEQLNALLVVGTPANAKIVEQLVSLLDVEAAALGNEVRIFPLKQADAARVGQIVEGIFRGREEAGALRQEDRLTVQPDVRTNALVVSTSPRSFAMLEGILRTLDAAEARATVGLHVLPIEGVSVTELAPKVERLMRERIEAATRSGDARSPTDVFTVEPDAVNNVLIVAASDENLQVVKELVESLKAGGLAAGAGIQTDLVPVEAGAVEEIAQAVAELYVKKENERRGEGAVSVMPSPRLNALIVNGTAADAANVRRLVQRLATGEITAVREFRRIELKSANASEVVTLLRAVLAGPPVSGRVGPGAAQATRLRYFRDKIEGELGDEEGMSEAEIDAVIRDQVTLTPDPRTNAVAVIAPPSVMKLLTDIILDLDATKAGEREIAKFQLKNADARQMAELLRDLFNLRRQGDTLVLIPSSGGEPPAPGIEEEPLPAGLDSATVTAVPDERQQLAITVDARTNTLLVSGTAEYLDLVSEVVNELDAIEATERERFVYRLKNAAADVVETTLQTYFRDEADRLRGILSPEMQGSVSGQLEREVTVVGDLKSNTVLVSASPRYIDMVREMVRELDSAPPQVLIQVLFAEVTLDNAKEWGMDAEVKNFGGDMYNALSRAAGAGVLAALGVPNLAFSSTDFELLIRALVAQGKIEILSRPKVTVDNNETATLDVGENIAIVTGFETLQDGRVRAEVTREDVGLQVAVTPTINADGFVKLDISPSISAVSGRRTQISEDFSADIITQRKVGTVVTVKDGQTVVLGGLITSTEEMRKTKVPILGDIPGLGLAFRSMKKSDVKTELLVILTPRVIHGDSGESVELLDRLTRREIERLTPAGKIQEEIRSGISRDLIESGEVTAPEKLADPPVYIPFEPVEPPPRQ